jgi:hypothetical protein
MSTNNTIDRIELLKEVYEEIREEASTNREKAKDQGFREVNKATHNNAGLYAAMMMIHKRINKLNGGMWNV